MIENTAYINLSRQMALEREMAVIANNIANVSTTGYKGEDMVFHEFLVEPKNAKSPISFVLDFGTTRDFAQGEARRTDNPLDVMIFGKGFLSVDSGGGVMYTRQGNLRVNNQGELTTPGGFRVLSEGGQPIVLDAEDPVLEIARDGTNSDSTGIIGKIGVFRFVNEQDLEPRGDGLYASGGSPELAEDPGLLPGYVEGSNVNPVQEITRMIELSRQFQAIHTMMDREANMRNTKERYE